MSDIHLNRFRHLAQLAIDQPNARIEFNAEKGSVEAQKPSFSAQIGRFFTRHSVLLKRTENAAFAFYKALQNEYGEQIAKEAVGDLRGFQIKNGQVTVDATHFFTAEMIKSGLEVAGALQNQITNSRQEPVGLASAADANQAITLFEQQANLIPTTPPAAPTVFPPVAVPRTKLQIPEPTNTQPTIATPVAAPRAKLPSQEPSTPQPSLVPPVAAPRARQPVSTPAAAQQASVPTVKPRLARPALAVTPNLETIAEDAQEDALSDPVVEHTKEVTVAFQAKEVAPITTEIPSQEPALPFANAQVLATPQELAKPPVDAEPLAVAKPKGPPPPPRKPSKEYFEARARQEVAWRGLFGKESAFPANMDEAKTQLQTFISNNDARLKKSRWGAEATAHALWTGWQGAQSSLLSETEKTHHFALALEEFHRDVFGFSVDLAKDLTKVKITVVPHGIKAEGGVGKAVEVKVDGQRKIRKEFKEDREYPLQLDVTSDPGDAKLVRTSELTATFLHPNEFEMVIAPSHFLVEEAGTSGSAQYLVEVRDKEFRAWAKHRLTEHADDDAYELSIVGNLQDVAPGEELYTTFTKSSPTLAQTDAEQIAFELLYAMSVLGARGFVHGDLKPENIYYDSASKKLKLIDTGGLSKISKEPSRVLTTAFQGRRGHTPVYSIPTVSSYAPIGLEQDLFASGILLLEIDAVRHFCATGDDAIHQKFELFQNELSKTHARLKIGDLNATQAAEAVRQTLALTYPLSNTKIETVGLDAISRALNYTALKSPPDIEQHLKNIEELINKL